MIKDPLKSAAWAWLFLVLLVGSLLGLQWQQSAPKLATDILAMLPQEDSALKQQALKQMAAHAERQVLVLIGAQDAEQSRQAADRYQQLLAQAPVQIRHRLADDELQQWQQFFSQHYQGLLSQADRQALQMPDKTYWQQRALQSLQAPVSGGLSFAQDPFGLFQNWLISRPAGLKLSLNQQRLWLATEDRQWAVLILQLDGEPLSLDYQQQLLPQLQQAEQQLHQQFKVELLQTGVILYASAAASQAQQEISSIGLISTLGIVLLLLLLFRSLPVLILAFLPMLVGSLLAVACCLWLFEQLHLITLVFGASLLGVAVDYSLHCFAAYLGPMHRLTARQCLQQLNPGMTLAMWTTVIAYLALALAPFPGLQQMAVFASVGLIAAWATVVLWYPFISPRLTPQPQLLSRIEQLYQYFPRWQNSRLAPLILLALTGLALSGLPNMSLQDDVRALQRPPATLLHAQQQIQQLLELPSPGQFFLLQAENPEQLLQANEALSEQLSLLQQQGWIGGYQSLSDQIPSQQRQQANHQLSLSLYRSPGPLTELAQQLGKPDWPSQLQQPLKPLSFDDWLQSPVSAPWRHLWLGRIDGKVSSLISLNSVRAQSLPELAKLAGPHRIWFDKPAQISQVLSHYRHQMSWVIAGSYLAIFGLLLRRYRTAAWRIILPTSLATGLTLSLLAWLGQPVQLFTVLALFIVLGIGVDFGIFLQEQTAHQDNSAALAVSASALTTLLSFGLLAWSDNPALQSFGLTNLLGLGFCWLLTAAFAQPEPGISAS